MNGELVKELKRVIDEPNQISQKAVNSLLLSSMVEIHENINNMYSLMQDWKRGNEELRESIEKIFQRIEDISCVTEEAMTIAQVAQERVDAISNDFRSVSSGPFHAIERYARQYPKTAIVLFLLLLMFLDARVIAHLILPFLAWLGVPPLTIQKLFEIFG